jgi:hypothetical protein
MFKGLITCGVSSPGWISTWLIELKLFHDYMANFSPGWVSISVQSEVKSQPGLKRSSLKMKLRFHFVEKNMIYHLRGSFKISIFRYVSQAANKLKKYVQCFICKIMLKWRDFRWCAKEKMMSENIIVKSWKFSTAKFFPTENLCLPVTFYKIFFLGKTFLNAWTWPKYHMFPSTETLRTDVSYL